MKQTNNNFGVLPFYPSVDEQLHRQSYAFGRVYPLYAPNDRLLPFQIMVPADTRFSALDLLSLQGEVVQEIIGGDAWTANIVTTHTVQDADYALLINTGTDTLAETLPEGQYYLRLRAGNNLYFSEVFTVVSQLGGYLHLSWWDVDDFVMDAGRIVYNLSGVAQTRVYGSGPQDVEAGGMIAVTVNNAQIESSFYTFFFRGENIGGLTMTYTDVEGQTQTEPVNDFGAASVGTMTLPRGANVLTITNTTADTIHIDAAALLLLASGVQKKFRHELYLCAQIGRPEYEYEEEGNTRDGYFFPEKQISEKTYKFQFVAPEYLLDAMRLMRLSDYVQITDQYRRGYSADTFLITPKWLPQGALAAVDAEFQTDTVAKKLAWAAPQPAGGSFDESYNDDYSKQR